MDWGLREQVRFCWVGERPVFLDIGADRYYGLPSVAEAAFAALACGARPAEAGLEALERTALVSRNGGAPLAPTAATPCTASLVDDRAAGRRPSVLALAELVIRLGRARRRVARTPFSRLVARLGERKAACAERCNQAAPERRNLALAFNAARRLAPHAPACLPDSIALLDVLAARRLGADLVFGVRLDPFAAHCWVQAGGEALNDGLAAVRSFSPILVV